jgi:hypothetical protein
MTTEATKRQLEKPESSIDPKPGPGGSQGTPRSHNARTAEERYGSHRDPHVQGGSAGAQQNPQGKQEPQEQPGQTRERGGSTQHSGGSTGQHLPPPAQQGQHGEPSSSGERGSAGQQGQKRDQRR